MQLNIGYKLITLWLIFMGEKISKQQNPPEKSELTSINDPCFGGAILVDRTKTKAYQEFHVDQMSANFFNEQLSQRKKLHHLALLTVNRSWTEQYRAKCSLEPVYLITVEYIYMNRNLEDEIGRYCTMRMPFPEHELRQIFKDVVSCLLYLQNNHTCHGDIKPKNILFSKNGRAFLTDSYFMNGGRVAFEIVMEDPQSLSLLSPQQLECIRNKKFVSLKDIHKDEIFAVGLTMLEAMTAEPALQAYDLANLRFKRGYFENKYHELRSYNYSHQLSSITMECLRSLPQQRISFEQFLSALSN